MGSQLEEKQPSVCVDPDLKRTTQHLDAHHARTPDSTFRNLETADEALQAVGNNADCEAIEIDEETNRKLLRKIDMHVMPMMCIVYGLNYLDKTTLSYASIMELETDLNLTKHNYQWLVYFGYLGFEYPTSRLLQRLPLAKYSALNIIFWGLTLSCIASVRFILGVLEAAVTPGFVLFTSQWYTKEEQGLRTGIWFSFNGFANVLGGLVAYGVAKAVRGQSVPVAGWKIIFLI